MSESILVFGVGDLQKSLIERCKAKNLFVVGIDPQADATCRELVDAFEIVDGQDFEKTVEIAERYQVKGIITAATDKPLVMMARVAKKLGFPFYSIETAQWSTDKFQMKQRFLDSGVPCAKGFLMKADDSTSSKFTAISSKLSSLNYPLIVKPRDNSGSRGVKICNTPAELQASLSETLQYSHLDSVLVEEVIEGPEYSIESLHHGGISEVIQFTEKKTTPFPYNVELGHKQPANLSVAQKDQIREIVSRIGKALHFENCPSHTELKVNSRGIFIIETSPRLGGDYITSMLTPISTGINLEDQLIRIALGEPVDTKTGRVERASGVCFFSFPEGKVTDISPGLSAGSQWPMANSLQNFQLKLKVGDTVNQITSSLNRYGQFIVSADTREKVDEMIEKYENIIRTSITIE